MDERVYSIWSSFTIEPHLILGCNYQHVLFVLGSRMTTHVQRGKTWVHVQLESNCRLQTSTRRHFQKTFLISWVSWILSDICEHFFDQPDPTHRNKLDKEPLIFLWNNINKKAKVIENTSKMGPMKNCGYPGADFMKGLRLSPVFWLS